MRELTVVWQKLLGAMAFILLISNAFALVSAPATVQISPENNSFEAVVFNDTGSAENAMLQLFGPSIEYIVSPELATIAEGSEQAFEVTITNTGKLAGKTAVASIVALVDSTEQRKSVELEFVEDSAEAQLTGLIVLPEISDFSWVDGLLLAIIAVLVIAVLARLIHRAKY